MGNYDSMKHFLNITRGIKKRSMLKEDEVKTTLTADELSQEEQTMRDAIGAAIHFVSIKFYDSSVEFRGSLPQLRIDWIFDSSEVNGVYIQIPELVQMNPETLQTLQKLSVYFQEWSQKWNTQLYGGNNGEE